MNKSEFFKKAHTITKRVIKAGDNYRVTFGACLKMLKEKIDVNLKKWDKNGENRIYVNSQTGGLSFGFLVVDGDNVDYSNVREDYLKKIKDAIAKKLVKFKADDEDNTEADVIKYSSYLTI